MIIDLQEAKRKKLSDRIEYLQDTQKSYCPDTRSLQSVIDQTREQLLDCQDNSMTCAVHVGELSFLHEVAGMKSDSSPNLEGGGVVSPHTHNHPVLTRLQVIIRRWKSWLGM